MQESATGKAEPQAPPAGDEALAALESALAEARAARAARDHARSRALAVETIERALKELAEREDAEALALLASLGSFAFDAGELRAAERAQKWVLEVRERTLPADHPGLQTARWYLGKTLFSLGDLAEARALFERVVEVYERTLPADHRDLQATRTNLALTMRNLGDLAGARALLERVLEVLERTLPPDHPNLQMPRLNLGVTLFSLGDLAGARRLFERVLEVHERTLPPDHPSLQLSRLSLAGTLYSIGDLARARSLQEAVLEVRERTLPADHPDLQWARANLAGTLNGLGDLVGARALFERVVEVYERTLPADHPYLLKAQGNLAETMRELGDLAGARALQEMVLEAFERTRPADHPDVLGARGNLAVTLASLGDFHGAHRLQEAVLDVRSQTLPADHPDLQISRLNLAAAKHRLGDLAGARSLQEAVLEVRERTIHPDHPDFQAARLNLAVTFRGLGDFAGARALMEQVLEDRERKFPADHPSLWRVWSSLAVTIAYQAAEEGGGERGGRERCAELVRKLGLAHARAALLAISMGSAREAQERGSRNAEELMPLISFALGCGVFEPIDALLDPAFGLSETARGAGLASARLARATRGSAEHTRLAAELRDATRELTALAQRGASNEEFHAARGTRERLERELGRVARELGAGKGWVPEELAAVLGDRLGDGHALVGFRRYTRWGVEPEEPSPASDFLRVRDRFVESLGAFVLAREEEGGEPRLAFVDLGPCEPIEDAVSEWRAAIGVGAGEAALRDHSLPAGRGVGLSADPSATALASGRALRRLVWDPLQAALCGAQRVILAPDDILHLLPFDALPLDEEGELVGDRWRIEMRAALWELLDPVPAVTAGGMLVALGGAAFDEAPAGLEESEEDAPRVVAVRIGSARLLRGSAWGAGFTPLAHTGPEALEIAALFAEQRAEAEPAIVLEHRRASREALEEAAPRARFLHVATHGWFAPESVRSWEDVQAESGAESLWQRAGGEEVVRGMSPMLLCGLALSGANLPPDALGRVSGLITAEELSTLDLASCELAVLSACDTNVGERRAGQGVASLQMALQMAGARSVITSLWKVPDEATRELMVDFYRRLWVEKKPKHQALWEAKKRLREARDERGAPRYTTRDWAAWVLTGESD